jgi:hypothetical protein
MLSNAIKREVSSVLKEHNANMLLELDPNKYYILVVPLDVDQDQLKKEFEHLRGKVNITVLVASGVRLLEIG